MDKLYKRINFEDSPSTKTPLSAANLNQMDKAINDLDDRIIDISEDLEKRIESGELDGADGKSAYEFAKDGGYTGTEAEFAEKLAMEVPSKEEFSRLSSEKVDKTGITLDKDADGLIYIFIDGKPVGNGVEVTGEIVEGDVIGTLDENNNLLLSGDIADGTYTLKWLKKDGTYADAGNLIVSSITKYAINTTLSNCSASGATTINGGGSATVTITASSGYELPDTISVSGASYTWDKTTGNIVLSNPTSDVYITVMAEEPKTNFFDASQGFVGRLSSSGADRTDMSSTFVTNYIAVQQGDIIEINGCAIKLWLNENDYNNGTKPAYMTGYNSSKANVYTDQTYATNAYWTVDSITENHAQLTILDSNIAYLRFVCGSSSQPWKSKIDTSKIVINIKRNGEWL